MNNLDPVVSDPPSDDKLARAIVMALQGHGESDTRFQEDRFQWQLSHRFD